MSRVLLVFIDGIGFGRPGAQNPFDGAPVNLLAPLADARVVADGGARANGVIYGALDATLGHAGLPQSATGQATIFTGQNAAEVHGGHREGYPTYPIAQLIQAHSVLARARGEGFRAGLLNAYDDVRVRQIKEMCAAAEGPRPVKRPARRPSASSLAAMAGGGTLRTFADVERGAAATFDLTGEMIRAFGVDAPGRSIGEAAIAVATGAREVDLGLFEMFMTDKAGHAQDIAWARHEIARTERFLVALFAAVDPQEQLVVVTSDHGNLEDLGTRSHTRADVPLMAYGRGASAFVEGAASLMDVAPRLLDHVRRG